MGRAIRLGAYRNTIKPEFAYSVVSDPGGDYSPGATFPWKEVEWTLQYYGFNLGTVLAKQDKRYRVGQRHGALVLDEIKPDPGVEAHDGQKQDQVVL